MYWYLDTFTLYFNFDQQSSLVLNLVNLLRFDYFIKSSMVDFTIQFVSIKNNSVLDVLDTTKKHFIKVFNESVMVTFSTHASFLSFSNQITFEIVPKSEILPKSDLGLVNCSQMINASWSNLIRCNMVKECLGGEDELSKYFLIFCNSCLVL